MILVDQAIADMKQKVSPNTFKAKVIRTISPFVKIGSRFSGVVMMLAGLGVWAVPSNLDTVSVLLKFGMSMTFFLLGFVIWQIGKWRGTTEIQLDLENRTISRVKRTLDGGYRVRSIIPFEDLSDVVLKDGILQAHAAKTGEVIFIPLDDPQLAHKIAELLYAEIS